MWEPEMTPIYDEKIITLEDIENVIERAQDDAIVRFSAEAISKRHGALRDAARLQALVTIAKKSKDQQLHLNATQNQESTLSELCTYAPGLTALRLNDVGVNLGGRVISRRNILPYATKKMVETDNQEFAKVLNGRTIDICCISGAERQYMSPLFTTKSAMAVKPPAAMSRTIVDILKLVTIRDFNLLDPGLLDAFGVFASELFKNTQEHACRDENGQEYISHVEGMITSFIEMDASIYKGDYTGHERLLDYWNSRSEKNDDGKREKLRCFQISFFDTGPGITGRAFGDKYKNAPSQDERKGLLKCIEKNFSSKNQVGAGHGYPTILTQLSKIGGLIRIRTGRQCIFNCFTKEDQNNWMANPVEQVELIEEKLMNFDDWSKRTLSPVAGTVVSVIVPLRKESDQYSLF
ncbi:MULTISPECIES: hypothetical protein [Pectobacterium]|nr:MULTISPECIES: hypothetical protein [Pectobacterium]MBN3228212.1 hypothetical protein [Pectobacterium brasiliense]MCA6943762.1 hypothetical protein [Pectobacterium polaris]MCA6959323.1 hypothetical protein [Pectobacterium polaris]